MNESIEKKMLISALRRRQRQAIAVEDYEAAAALRDQIRALTGEVGAAVQRARRGKRRDRAGAVEQDRAALGVHERAGEKPPHEDVRA